MLRVPRFVSSSVIATLVGSYLTLHGVHVIISDANVLINPPPSTFDCVIYESPEYYIPTTMNSIILFGWGDNSSTIERLILNQFTIVCLDDTSFNLPKRTVIYRMIPIKINDEAKEWYDLIDNSSLSPEEKSQAGNYMYAGHTKGDELEVLKKVKYLSSETLPLQKDIRVIADFAPSLPPSLKTLSNITVNRAPSLSGSSPKLSVMFREFLKRPGKYVVYTNFSKAYGANLLAAIAENKYHLPIRRLNHTDDIEQVTDSFNASDQEILITCRIPQSNLKNVSVIVIVDTYDAQIVANLIQKCYPNDPNPLHVVFIFQYMTKEEEHAQREMQRLKDYESIYTSFDNFTLLHQDDTDIIVG